MRIKGYQVESTFNDIKRIYGKFFTTDYSTIITCYNAAKKCAAHNTSMQIEKIY
jgi:hypothetical protein